MINLNEYAKMVDQKVNDAWENWNEAEKKALQARKQYEIALAQRDAFESALKEMESAQIFSESLRVVH